MDPVVVIGFGIGAIGAVRTLLGNTKEPDVIVIERRDFDTYSPCGMPYVISKEVEAHEHLKHSFPPNRRLTIKNRTEAVSVDASSKTVHVRSLETSEEEDIVYSSLIIDAGSRPFIPPISFNKELLGNGIYTFTTPSDVDTLEGALQGMGSVAIIGSGAIGLEMAQALHERGKEVVLVEMMELPMAGSFDKDMAKMAIEALPEGIDTRFSSALKAIEGETKVEAIEVGEERIPVDAVILSIGVVPETTLAASAGLETSKMGVVVDDQMHTSDHDIYAVGDCIQSWCSMTKQPLGSRIAVPALFQGTVAGNAIAGGDRRYNGSNRAFVTVVGGKQFAAVGAKTTEIEGAVSAKVKVKCKPEFMHPGEVAVKLVANPQGQIIGAQAVGPNAAQIINRVSLAMDAKMTAQALSLSETAYCPPVSDVFDPLTTAAETLRKKLARRKK